MYCHHQVLDLYHVHEDSPFTADLSTLPKSVKLLGLQVGLPVATLLRCASAAVMQLKYSQCFHHT